ncbi:FadR/GntR family transcriptional regulator [Nocardia alni]|uniref:FadR/GntR family transcriptional regulator n=1 Tax=Nocardia alni TaxID=2815723 RepID=UPI001C220EF6|nr:FCD domain-containing protein [Nocardia alni]
MAAAPVNGYRADVLRRRIPKMAEVVAADLRQRILRGEFVEGDSLSPESALVEEYEISRPTLREALRLLEAQQLISVRRGSHKGAVVSLPGSDLAVDPFTILLQLRGATLNDVYRFRMIFEPQAVRIAAEKASAQEISDLRELLDQEARARRDAKVFPGVAWRFHTELVRLSGNVTMTLVAETLERISERHARTVASEWPDAEKQLDRAYRAHKKLVGLIADRQGEEAERFWAKHMATVGKQLISDADRTRIIELPE